MQRLSTAAQAPLMELEADEVEEEEPEVAERRPKRRKS